MALKRESSNLRLQLTVAALEKFRAGLDHVEPTTEGIVAQEEDEEEAGVAKGTTKVPKLQTPTL